MAPIYYAYGDVLLRVVESSNDALGGPAEEEEDGEDDDDDDDENDEEGEQEGKTVPASATTGSKSATEATEEDITEEGAQDGNGNEETTGNDDLEIAWNCLDVARVIYSRIDTNEAQLQLAKAQLRLGDCQMESDRFDQALEEYQSCLTIRSRLLPKSDR